MSSCILRPLSTSAADCTAEHTIRKQGKFSLYLETVIWHTKFAAAVLVRSFIIMLLFFMTQAALVVSLVKAYGLLDKMTYVSLCIKLLTVLSVVVIIIHSVVAPPSATMMELTSFHASYYIDYLKQHNSGCHDDDSGMEEYGLGT